MLLEKETLEKYGRWISSGCQLVVKCDYCGNVITKTVKARKNSNKDFDKDACFDCRFLKRKEKSLALYGVENAAQRPEIKNKLSNIKWDDLKPKIVEMHEEGYSVSYIADKLSIPHTSLDRKMHRWDLHHDSSISSRRKKTMVERYGEDYGQISHERLKKTAQKKYGVDNVFQAEEIKDKIKQTNIDKYGVDHHMKQPEFAKKTVQKGIDTRIKNGSVQLHNGRTASDFAKEIGFSRSHFSTLIKKFGFEKAVTLQPRQSSLEKLFEQHLDENNIDYDSQFKVSGKVADIRIGDVIVELDGLYWHSDAVQQNKRYHIEKRQLYLDNGFKPLFFYEDEINNKIDIVWSMVMNHLGSSPDRIFARKTQPVEGVVGKEFFETNHLMGKGRGRTYSLLYNDEPVCSIQISRLKNKDYDVSRFCCKKGVNVIGGFSKLLSFAEKQLDMNSLRTFIDLRYGSGDYLTDFGFIKGKSSPSFCWTDGKTRFHRLKFKGSSGYKEGLSKLWDCGQLPFVKKY